MSTPKRARKILDPIRPGLLPVEDIRAAVRAVAAEEAAGRGHRVSAEAAKGASPAKRHVSKCLS
jgi:hypothetical protein